MPESHEILGLLKFPKTEWREDRSSDSAQRTLQLTLVPLTAYIKSHSKAVGVIFDSTLKFSIYSTFAFCSKEISLRSDMLYCLNVQKTVYFLIDVLHFVSFSLLLLSDSLYCLTLIVYEALCNIWFEKCYINKASLTIWKVTIIIFWAKPKSWLITQSQMLILWIK